MARCCELANAKFRLQSANGSRVYITDIGSVPMSENKANILILDDEIYIQEILNSTLTDAGFECACAGDVKSALEALSTRKFEIIFIDVALPGMHGLEFLEQVKAQQPSSILIVLSETDSAGLAMEFIKEGVYDYIVKPFNLDQVLASANRAIEKRRLDDSNGEYQKFLENVAEERAAETRRLFYAMTQVLVRLLDLKTPYNAGHALRVAEKSRYVARELRMTEDGVRKVYLAALLHDVMMIGVDDLILTKRGALTPDEQGRIQARTSMAQEMLKPILDDEEVLKNIQHLRERFDGTGYPDGLKGMIIPLGSRIIAVVEAFDAMIQERPYRSALSPEAAIAELHRCAETQFDPQVVATFKELYYDVLRNLDRSSGPV
jgi:cyclic di-GMP phosphodiesterase